MFTRIAASVVLGTLVTCILLFAMQAMVASGRGELNLAREYRVDNFVRVDRSMKVSRKSREIQEPPKPELRPQLPTTSADTHFDAHLSVAFAAPAFDTGLKVGRASFGVGDGDLLPLVKVTPVYPSRALARKLEGFVLVEFVVTPTGSVKDVRVVESSSQIFEKSAIEAALKFKYRPRVVNGEAVEVHGVRNMIMFTMQA